MGLHEREWHARNGAAIKRALEIEANSVNLPAMLASRGFNIKRESNNNDYGLSKTPAGSFGLRFNGQVWLAYQNSNGGFAGNAVMLMELINGYDKNDAIKDILGEFKIKPNLKNNSKHIEHIKSKEDNLKLTLPTPQPKDISAGKAYLASRSIDVSTFESLRATGNAEYAWNGIAFLGKKADGNPGLQEIRLFQPLERKDKPGKFTNHLVKGSRQHCVVIIGSDGCKNVEIVEGNFDGMALYEMNKRNLPAENQPSIIISGGKDNLKMLENPAIVDILAAAVNIKCWGDNEQISIDSINENNYLAALKIKQDSSDESHKKRIAAICSIYPNANITYVKPPADVHDLADWNKKIKDEMPKLPKFKF